MYGWARRHGSAGIREQRLEQVRNGCIGFVEGHSPRLRLGLGIARMIVNFLEPLTGELRLRRRPLGRALWGNLLAGFRNDLVERKRDGVEFVIEVGPF
jgi:hypothetical protein